MGSLRAKLIGLVTVALAAMAITSPTANASALGCTGGNPSYGPSTYCNFISGSGTFVGYVSGTFRGSAFVCNYNITVSFYNRYWQRYQSVSSPIRWGCATGDGAAIGINAYKQPGYECSTLNYNNPWGTRSYMTACNAIN